MELNVISFDNPYPPNYGGAIDIYYKLKALYNLGVKIHLHFFGFINERPITKELKELCSTIDYYDLKEGRVLLFNKIPYIILCRSSDLLKENLFKNDFPVLMEGLHSTYLLKDDLLHGRKTIVRTCNVEHDYYISTAQLERNLLQKCYFYSEAWKLKKFERVLKRASAIATVSPNDTDYFSKLYSNVHYVPVFHNHNRVAAMEGRGDYALYFGSLDIGENNQAALFLVNEVFNDSKHRLIIAGKNPSKELVNAVKGKLNINLESNHSFDELKEYTRNAQCIVLPTFQSTGIKHKLIFALFAGRFCIVNKPMVQNTGLESLCLIADTAVTMKKKINEVFKTEFTSSEIKRRESVLMRDFSNEKNAQKLLHLIFND